MTLLEFVYYIWGVGRWLGGKQGAGEAKFNYCNAGTPREKKKDENDWSEVTGNIIDQDLRRSASVCIYQIGTW